MGKLVFLFLWGPSRTQCIPIDLILILNITTTHLNPNLNLIITLIQKKKYQNSPLTKWGLVKTSPPSRYETKMCPHKGYKVQEHTRASSFILFTPFLVVFTALWTDCEHPPVDKLNILYLRYWLTNTPTRCVPVCTCRWWSLSDDSAWGSWSHWQSPGPCPPPSSSGGRRGADAPAASRPGHQRQHTLVMFPSQSFNNVKKAVTKLQKHHDLC